MKPRGNRLKAAAIRACKPTTVPGLTSLLFICGLLAACSPSPDTTPPPPRKESRPAVAPSSVVSIPEEFLSPSPTPKQPVLPRVLFATSDFQVTTQHGIQGIRAGEAVNFIREVGGDFVMQYRGIEFRKNRSYFAATYVEPPRPESTPFAGEVSPVATDRVSAEPSPPGDTRLSEAIPGDDPALVAGQKKVGDLTESIRALNDQIRSAQEELEKKSARTSGAEKNDAAEIKQTSRAIQKLKSKRDEISGQLTEMGKP